MLTATDGRRLDNSGAGGKGDSSGPPLVINVSAVASGLTVNVSLHPSLNAVYEVDPVHFLGQIGPHGYLDMTVTKHVLSFEGNVSTFS